MKIVVDESVSYRVVSYLRKNNFEVTAISEILTSGLKDREVFELVKK